MPPGTRRDAREQEASFDCALDERARWVEHVEQRGFAVWLGALQRFMAAH